MTPDNDLTLRQDFQNLSKNDLWDDRRIYFNTHEDDALWWLKDSYQIKLSVLAFHKIDETHLFIDDRNWEEKLNENFHVMMLNTFGPDSRYTKEAQELFEVVYGESTEHCDCCGNDLTPLNSTGRKSYLCSDCDAHFQREGEVKIQNELMETIF